MGLLEMHANYPGKKKLPPSWVYMSLVIILGRDGDTDVGI